MPKVLHIGPCDTPGGMANVMRILAEHPPEGWQAELLSSHVVGSPWAKWRAYRKARKSLIQILSDDARRPDIVHLHTAADWSWWRKRRFAQLAHKAGVPNIVHIHSGQFHKWISSSTHKVQRFNNTNWKSQSHLVVLTESWKEKFQPLIGNVTVIQNPVNPALTIDESIEREPHHLLLLGRDDPVKGHSFAIDLVQKLREKHPHVRLTMTGKTESQHDWVDAKGWVSEEDKLRLLQKACVLLVPSTFEGQPLVVLEALTVNCPVIVSDCVHGLPSTVVKAKFGDILSWVEAYNSMSLKDVYESSKPYAVKSIQAEWEKYYDEILCTSTFAEELQSKFSTA